MEPGYAPVPLTPCTYQYENLTQRETQVINLLLSGVGTTATCLYGVCIHLLTPAPFSICTSHLGQTSRRWQDTSKAVFIFLFPCQVR